MTKTLNKDFNFFDFTPKEVNEERKKEISDIISNNELRIKERNERQKKESRYLKATTLRLG